MTKLACLETAISIRFPPAYIVDDVSMVQTPESGEWWRLKFKPELVQRPQRSVASDQAWPFQGLHGTTVAGAICIARDRRVRALHFSGLILCLCERMLKSLSL